MSPYESLSGFGGEDNDEVGDAASNYNFYGQNEVNSILYGEEVKDSKRLVT